MKEPVYQPSPAWLFRFDAVPVDYPGGVHDPY